MPADRLAPTISIGGLRDLQRDIKAIRPDLRREIPQALKTGVQTTVLPVARARTPVLTGRLRASLRVSATQNRVSVYSRLPYANVIHWGGGVPNRRSLSTRQRHYFERRPFVLQALDTTNRQLVDHIGDSVESVAERHGWHQGA